MISISNVQTVYHRGSEIFKNFLKPSNKNQILDPISCIIRLGMLGFKPQGSKISINENKIKFNENLFYQGFLRWHIGDSRDDLHNLHNPIQKISEWYDSNIQEIKNIIQVAINGIKNLKLSYEDECIIQYTLNHYISILQESLKNKKEKKIIEKKDMDLSSSILKDEVLQDLESEKNNDLKDSQCINKDLGEGSNHIYNELKKLWTFREIKIINGIFSEINKKQASHKEELEAYLKSLEVIVESKENQVVSLIKKAYTIL